MVRYQTGKNAENSRDANFAWALYKDSILGIYEIFFMLKHLIKLDFIFFELLMFCFMNLILFLKQ